MNLYQISADYAQILDHLYDEEGNVNQNEMAKLEDTKLEMDKKAIAVASYIKNLDAERRAIDDAKKDMSDRERRYKKRIEDLEGYLLSNMERCGIDHIKSPHFDIKLKKCPTSVDIYDESVLPDEYKRTKTETLPDKVKIKEEMLAGVVIPGASIKNNLRLEIR